jgi:hypothetical protein
MYHQPLSPPLAWKLLRMEALGIAVSGFGSDHIATIERNTTAL